MAVMIVMMVHSLYNIVTSLQNSSQIYTCSEILLLAYCTKRDVINVPNSFQFSSLARNKKLRRPWNEVSTTHSYIHRGIVPEAKNSANNLKACNQSVYNIISACN